MTSVEQHQGSTESLARQAPSQALAVYTAYQAGQLSRDQAVALIVAVVNQSNAAAVSLRRRRMSAQVEHAPGIPTPATGIAPIDDAERLQKAVTTVLDEDRPVVGDLHRPDTEMRIERLARSEPLEASQNTTIDAMQQQPLVEGWTRDMDADPCQLCRRWWREGPDLAEGAPAPVP
jgi:hypothetical protein